MSKSIFFFFLILVSLSCNNSEERFNRDFSEGDLYRIPLMYPYELIRVKGLEKDMGATNSWDLNFHYNGDAESPGFSKGVSVSEINVSNGVIFGYDYSAADYPAVWFVIIPDKRIEKVFKGKKEGWTTFLRQNSISQIELFPVWDIFDQFRDYSKLPWSNSDKD